MRKHKGGRGSRKNNVSIIAGNDGRVCDYDLGDVMQARRAFTNFADGSPSYVTPISQRRSPYSAEAKNYFPALVSDLEMYCTAGVGLATIEQQIERRFEAAERMVKGLGEQMRETYARELANLHVQYQQTKERRSGSGPSGVIGQISPELVEARTSKRPNKPRRGRFI
jgi:hypothetical protein